MAKLSQALAYIALSAGYASECFHVNHPVIEVVLTFAYLVIAVKYLREAAKMK